VRRLFGWLLLFIGGFLLTAAIMGVTWLPGAAERTPLDVDTSTYLTGEADKLNPATGKLEHVPVVYKSLTRVDPDHSDGDVVAFVNTKCINVDENDPPECLSEDDDRLITNVIDTFATDRHTATAVNGAKYLAEGGVPHEGLVNKFPFNVEKKTYPYWDRTVGAATDAVYTGTRDIDGLETYEFTVDIPETDVEVIEDTAGTYETHHKLWVDPRTGLIIDEEGGQVLKLEDGTVILDIHVAYTDDTVQTNVDDAEASRAQLTLLLRTVPIVGTILGLLAVVGGLLLLRGRSRARTSSERAVQRRAAT